MGRVGAAALLLLAGCQAASPTPTCVRTPSPGPEAAVAEAPVFVGTFAEVALEVPADGQCSGERGPLVDAAVAEVTDALNRAVDAAVDGPVKVALPSGVNVWRAMVRFQPAAPGGFHVLVTFTPSGGIAQRDVQVAVDRRGPPVLTTSTPGADCDAVVFTARGSALCRLAGAGAKLFRGNVEAAAWQGLVQVEGDALWEVSPQGALSRAVDLGAGPPALSNVSAAMGAAEEAFVPRGGEAVWWRSRAIERLAADGSGGFTVVSRTDVAEDQAPDALAFAPDAGVALYGAAVKWGRVALAKATDAPLWHDVDALVAQEPDALWTQLGGAVQRVPADPAEALAVFTPPPGWAVRSDYARVGNYDSRPAFFPVMAEGMQFTRALVPVVGSSGVATLQYFEALTGTEFVGVAGGLLHARKGDEHYFWKVGQ